VRPPGIVVRACVKLASSYREVCREQRHLWDDDGNIPLAHLWLGREEAMSSFINWLKEEG